MPTLYMLVGVPGSGKSTWVAQQKFDANTVVVGTDAIIERRAAAAGKTYDQVFASEIGLAQREMAQAIRQATVQGRDIVWDQTNLTVKSRRGKLSQIPSSYRLVAVVFETPTAVELAARLAGRAGKTIPESVMTNMIGQFSMPCHEEFDQVIVIK